MQNKELKEELEKEKEEFAEEILNKIWKEWETWEIDFIVVNLLRENDTRTREEILLDAIKEIMEEVKNYKEKEDFIHDWADRNTEIYTTKLFRIYSKNAYFYYFINEAREEFGQSEDIIKDLQAGIYLALSRFASDVIKFYRNVLELNNM